MIGEIGDALVGARALAPGRRFAKLALDRRRQSREIAFDDVVVGAGLHRGNGDVFADRARHEDEGHIDALFAEHRERPRATERRHRVVGDGDVERRGPQHLLQTLGSVHLRHPDVISGLTERPLDQEAVVF